MHQSPVYPSEYLQNRVRERKAETARMNKNPPPSDATSQPRRRTVSGRDDDIFDLDDDPSKRKPSGRIYQSSPAGPVPSRSSQGRRTSNMTSASTSGPRAMGAREMEDHVDKLSKQNFDLKLEVYHRRERIAELEKKLETLPRLQEDNAELLEVNDELIQELDKRDKAIDEAVVMICDLEENIRDLQQDLQEEKAKSQRRRRSIARSIENTTPTGTRHLPLDAIPTPRFPNGGVSPDVSARMAELTTDEQNAHTPTDVKKQKSRQVPSFIDTTNTTTDALRSMFMDGNKMIRPLPSHASLVSQGELEAVEELEDVPPSPRMSMLSESDFKSIYGRDDISEAIASNQCDGSLEETRPESPSVASTKSSQAKADRTGQWVADRAISPARHPTVEHFQSLGNVLHNRIRDPHSSSKLERKQAARLRDGWDGTTPPFRNNPVYNQNTFPPTPDTMLTRPSNQSSTSISQDKSLLDGIAAPFKGHTSVLPSSTVTVKQRNFEPAYQGDTSNDKASADAQFPDGFEMKHDDGNLDLLPRFHPVSDEPLEVFPPQHHFSDPKPTKERFHHTASRSHDSDQASLSSPPRSNPSPSRTFNSRRRSVDMGDSPTLPTPLRPSMDSHVEFFPQLSHSRSIDAAASHPHQQLPSPSGSTLFLIPPSKQYSRLPHTDEPHTRHQRTPTELPFSSSTNGRPAHSPLRNDNSLNTPPHPSSEPPAAASSGRIPRHTAALRARVTRLARRNSNAASTNTATTNTDNSNSNSHDNNNTYPNLFASPPDPARNHRRSGSIGRRTRQLFQRRGSSAARKPAGSMSQPASPTKGLVGDRERSTLSSRGSAASVHGDKSHIPAVPPYLDLSMAGVRRGEKGIERGRGVVTNIPIVHAGEPAITRSATDGKALGSPTGAWGRRRRGQGVSVDAATDGDVQADARMTSEPRAGSRSAYSSASVGGRSRDGGAFVGSPSRR